MTIRTQRFEFDPDSVITRRIHESNVTTQSDVEAFVAALTTPNANEATVIHESRSLTQHPLTGHTAPDHSLAVAVAGDYGYAEYIGPGHWCQPVGAPTSPEYHTSRSDTMRAGSGVSLETLTRIVTEFLDTAELPHCVQWHEQFNQHIAHAS